MEGLSSSDVALLTRNNDGGMWGDGGAFFWVFALLLFDIYIEKEKRKCKGL